MIRRLVFPLAAIALVALPGCAGDRSIYGEPDNAVLRCNALPEPGARAACIERLGREAEARRDDPRTGPPACHPASTDPRDRDSARC